MEGSSKDYRDEPDLELGPDSSKPASGSETPPSPKTAAAIRKEKGRVRFNSNAAVTSPPVIPSSPPPETRTTPIAKPRPSLLRGNSSNSVTGGTKDIDDGLDPESKEAMAAAQERARLIAANLRRDSSAISRDSLESSVGTAYDDRESTAGSNIPLQDLSHSTHNRDGFQKIPSGEHEHPTLKEEAFKLVRSHTNRFENNTAQNSPTAKEAPRQRRETLTELNDGNYDGVVYDLPEPEQYRGSVLSQLLKLYKPPEPPFKKEHNRNASIASSIGGTSSPTVQGTPSGASTPTRKKWYNQNRSQDTLANLIEASARLANPNEGEQAGESKNGGKKHGRPPMHKRAHSANRLSGFWQQQEARITVHIAETLSRQDYIIKLCRALMLYGAPTHRLEEYLSMTARVLEIDGQFLYLPGCMIISFDDRSTHTTEVRIVRSAQGIDLGKLKDVHLIYKEVMHDCIGVEEATDKLDVLMKRKDKFHAWLRVIIFGLTSVTAAPFSFGARLIDLPLIFAFGCLVGVLQLIVAPNSALYSNVFEVTATVVVSFLARLFGSINNSNLFCFGALAQGGIVMLLPGYMVLCSSLELQSRAIVPGSIRIVYAIIYCLLLGFGITVGSALYGLFDDTPSNQATCTNPMDPYYGFIFVPPFVVCISMIYQAKWRQVPIMVIIAFAGYMVNYWSGQRFKSSPQISSTLGALAVGVLANLYSRLRHGVAAAILIPAVFCQVPGGLASTGGLLSGLSVANELTNNNGTINGTASVQVESGGKLDNLVFNVAASMIQIAIGIAVGLFMSALIIYPLGKRRSGLFSF